ncbi:MAG: long-chain fatty acid--CoA ligase [Bacteroidetes bacterium]|nr:MAG: long-chain fatty acid--CoA ligase [Bacteroidota bacterium]
MMKTIPGFFKNSVAKFADNVLIHEKKNGKYVGATYQEIDEQVEHFAAGLYDLGLRKGDRVALMAEGRTEWLVSELAMLYLGVIDVPLSVKLIEPKEIAFRINHSESKAVIVSESQLKKIRDICNELPLVETIIVFDDIKTNENELLYSRIFQKGKEASPELKAEVKKMMQTVEGDDVANITYTSGTTADPKGIMLTHRNYTANTEQGTSLFEIKEDYITLLILPWDHSFAHTVGLYTMIGKGASLAVVEKGRTPMETLKNIPKNIKEIKPYFLLSVPALAKNFKKNIESGIRQKGKITENLFKFALNLAYKYNKLGFDKGNGGTYIYKPLINLFDIVLFSKIREGFGGNLLYFVGGGALLDIELQRFFYAIGIPMYQGYGLSEAAPVISSNSPDAHKMGSSGRIVANLEIKILDDDGNEMKIGEKGEIVVKGENVMNGYWKNEKATKETLKNGWLHTGDIGYLDRDGFLYVLGRFKSLLIGNDGEKYSPEGIEEALADQSKYLEQVMLHNNQNPYTVGLIVPNVLALKEKIKAEDVDVKSDEAVELALKVIKGELGKYLSGGEFEDTFPARWLPASIGIPEESFNEENGLMNATMKVIRGNITKRFDGLIDFLYTPEGKNIINERNKQSMKKWLVG